MKVALGSDGYYGVLKDARDELDDLQAELQGKAAGRAGLVVATSGSPKGQQHCAQWRLGRCLWAGRRSSVLLLFQQEASAGPNAAARIW